jgi:TP901 family phage tail tape measure protein
MAKKAASAAGVPDFTLEVAAHIGAITGADIVLRSIKEDFAELQIPLELEIGNETAVTKVVAKVTNMWREVTKSKNKKGEEVQKDMMTTLIEIGDKIHRIKSAIYPNTDDVKSKDADGNEVITKVQNSVRAKVVGVKTMGGIEAFNAIQGEIIKTIEKLNKSSGNPTQIKELKTRYDQLTESLKHYAVVLEKAYKLRSAVDNLPDRKALPGEYGGSATKLVEETINANKKKFKDAYADIAYNNKQKVASTVSAIDKLNAKMFSAQAKVIVSEQITENKSTDADYKAKMDKAGVYYEKQIQLLKNFVKKMYQNGLLTDKQYADFNAINKGNKAQQKEKILTQGAFTSVAEQSSKKYAADLKEISRLTIEINKASASMSLFTTKKDETKAYILSQQKLLALAEKRASKNKEIMVAGGLTTKANDMYAESEEKTNTAIAKFNALGKRKIKFLEDIKHGFTQAAARVINYTAVYRSLWFVIGQGKQAIQTIIELNKNMTNIRMVIGGTQASTMKLMDTYNKLAIAMGATTAEVSEAAVEFLRQGRTVSETNKLIESAMVLSKVGFVTSAEATEYLTSVLNGYEMEVNDVTRVVDAMSQVDIKAATSVKELAIALQQSANSARNAGVPFERLLGYVGAVSERTRKSAETIGQAFKTMFARMQNIKVGKFVDDDTNESLNDTEKVLGKIGISLRYANGDWRALSTVLDDLNQKWDTLNQTERNAVAVALGGVRQREILLALMDSYDRALFLEQEALNSSGAAAEKYQSYLSGIEAKQKKLKATVESIAFTDFNQNLYSLVMLDIPKVLLDIAKAFKVVEIAVVIGANAMGAAIKTQIVESLLKVKQDLLLSNNQASINEFLKQKTGMSLVKPVDKDLFNKSTLAVYAQKAALLVFNKAQLKTMLISRGFTESMVNESLASQQFSFALTGAAKASEIFKIALSQLGAFLKANWIMVAIQLVMVAISEFNKMNVTLEEQKEIVSKLNDEVKQLSSTYEELRNKSDRTSQENAYLEILGLQIEALKKKAALQKEIEYKKAFGSGSAATLNTGASGDSGVNNPSRGNIRYTSGTSNILGMEVDNYKYVDKDVTRLKELYKLLQNPKINTEEYDKLRKELINMDVEISNVVANLLEYQRSGLKITSDEQTLIDTYLAVTDANKNVAKSVAGAGYSYDNLTAIMGNVKTAATGLKDVTASLKTVWDEFAQTGELSASTVLDLISSGSDLIDIITVENGVYKISASAMLQKFENTKATTLANLLASKAALGSVPALMAEKDALLLVAATATLAADRLNAMKAATDKQA